MYGRRYPPVGMVELVSGESVPTVRSVGPMLDGKMQGVRSSVERRLWYVNAPKDTVYTVKAFRSSSSADGLTIDCEAAPKRDGVGELST